LKLYIVSDLEIC